MVTSASLLSTSTSTALDSVKLDRASNGSTAMGLRERREVIETIVAWVVAFLEGLRSVSAVREAYASGNLRLGPARPDTQAFLDGDAEVREPSLPRH